MMQLKHMEDKGKKSQNTIVKAIAYREKWSGWLKTSGSSSVQVSPVAQSCPTLCDPTNRSTPGLPVHHQLPESTQTHVHRVKWCHPTISSSVIHFSSCPQSLPASGSFQMSQLLTWGGQSIGVSASASVLPMNTQDWSPLGCRFQEIME